MDKFDGRCLDLRLFSEKREQAQDIKGEKTAPDAGEPTGDISSPDAGERTERFKELIRGEYKDLYDAQVQNILRQRLRGSEETRKKYEALAPALELLEKKYGVPAGDAEALSRAVQLEEKGEGARLRRRELKEGADRQYAEWIRQAGELAALYPDFDLKGELGDERFGALLRGGASLKDAYELVHRQSIMEKGARDMEEKIARRILSGELRPREGGISAASAALVKNDVSQMSKKTRQEIIRRVQRGEKISF